MIFPSSTLLAATLAITLVSPAFAAPIRIRSPAAVSRALKARVVSAKGGAAAPKPKGASPIGSGIADEVVDAAGSASEDAVTAGIQAVQGLFGAPVQARASTGGRKTTAPKIAPAKGPSPIGSGIADEVVDAAGSASEDAVTAGIQAVQGVFGAPVQARASGEASNVAVTRGIQTLESLLRRVLELEGLN
ncbi:hypothetical protein PLICRDRAFT_55739 [Plicaturopsis crispa FD-325 SS-3]|nr:hypothetical protein PLICRDRAFT_55739 [Plicaturopsis crispa FD-325 SS-3]